MPHMHVNVSVKAYGPLMLGYHIVSGEPGSYPCGGEEPTTHVNPRGGRPRLMVVGLFASRKKVVRRVLERVISEEMERSAADRSGADV